MAQLKGSTPRHAPLERLFSGPRCDSVYLNTTRQTLPPTYDRINKGFGVQVESIVSRAQCAEFERKRIPRRGCCGYSMDGSATGLSEGTAPGVLLPLINAD